MERLDVLVGDIHGNFDHLDWVVDFYVNTQGRKPDSLIQVGDFGIWSDIKSAPKKYRSMRHSDVPVYFADGNHDNHDFLDKFKRGTCNPVVKGSNFFHCAFGHVKDFGDKRVAFFGGANSIDANRRIPHVSWWPTEQISRADMEWFLDHKDDFKGVNTVVSHTTPRMAVATLFDHCTRPDGSKMYDYLDPDWSRVALEEIFDTIRPDHWVMGHWHCYADFRSFGTRFTALSLSSSIVYYSYPQMNGFTMRLKHLETPDDKYFSRIARRDIWFQEL